MRNYIGQTTPPSGSNIDWSAILSGALNFGQAYFDSRQRPGGTPLPPPPPPATGMSQTTKALLIGGGVIAAGLLVYVITKKK